MIERPFFTDGRQRDDNMNDVALRADVDFILKGAPRLAKLAAMAGVSFGLGEGANRALKLSPRKPDMRSDDWEQAVLGYRDGTLMMAVIRVALLLDADDRVVSFQTIYHRLKNKDVQNVLIERVHGTDFADHLPLDETPATILQRFLTHYASIDWKIHGRLTHFRNFGVAHLLETPLSEFITHDELKELVSVITKLADELVALCRTTFVLIEPMTSEWSDRGYSIMSSKRPARN